MIQQSICEALGSASAYECGITLMKQQGIALLLLTFVPYLLFFLLFIARAKFKKNAGAEVLMIAGVPLLVLIILLLIFPFIINTI